MGQDGSICIISAGVVIAACNELPELVLGLGDDGSGVSLAVSTLALSPCAGSFVFTHLVFRSRCATFVGMMADVAAATACLAGALVSCVTISTTLVACVIVVSVVAIIVIVVVIVIVLLVVVTAVVVVVVGAGAARGGLPIFATSVASVIDCCSC